MAPRRTTTRTQRPRIVASTPQVEVSELDTLRARVAELEQSRPKFIPMQQAQMRTRERRYTPSAQLVRAAMRGLAKGGAAQGQTRWLDTPQGREGIPPDYRPIFAPGDMVILNPEAVIWGSERTWSEVLDDKIHTVGTIVGTMYMTNTWEPKYKVQFQGITKGSGDGFRESELLPYEGA